MFRTFTKQLEAFTQLPVMQSPQAQQVQLHSAVIERILDVDLESNTNPIRGIKDAAQLSLNECVQFACDHDASMAQCSFEANLFCAHFFADDLQGEDDLTPDEIACIHLYTQQSPWYRILNSRLRERNRELLKPFLPYIRLLLTALYKLPQNPGMLYRGVKKNIQASLTPGKRLLWWSFSSSAVRVDVLESPEFLGKNGDRTLMTINAKTGVDIRKYSAFPHEHEVLLLAGTCLKVESVLNAGHGLHVVQLTELEVPDLLDFNRVLMCNRMCDAL